MTTEPREENAALLAKAEARGWFAAHKTAGLWARQLERPEVVNTLEGPSQAAAGDYLCRGPAGELWPQAVSSLLAKYTPTNEIDGEGFRRWVPDPAASRVMASELAGPVVVVTSWGRLEAAAGDFLVKSWGDRGNPRPSDVWPVSREVFEASYERLDDEERHDD